MPIMSRNQFGSIRQKYCNTDERESLKELLVVFHLIGLICGQELKLTTLTVLKFDSGSEEVQTVFKYVFMSVLMATK